MSRDGAYLRHQIAFITLSPVTVSKLI